MEKLHLNDVTLEQLKILAEITAAVSKASIDAEKKLRSAGKTHASTTNWSSSGVRGAELLVRFAVGVLGSIEVANAQRLYEQLEQTQEGRAGSIKKKIVDVKTKRPPRKK